MNLVKQFKNLLNNFISRKTSIFILFILFMFPLNLFVNNNISYNTNFKIDNLLFSESKFNNNNYKPIKFKELYNILPTKSNSQFYIFKNDNGVFLNNYFSDFNLEKYKDKLQFFKDEDNNIAITNNDDKLLYYTYTGQKGQELYLDRNIPFSDFDREYFISKNGKIHYLYNKENNKYTYINEYKILDIKTKVISTAEYYEEVIKKRIFSTSLFIFLLLIHFFDIYFFNRKDKNKKDISKMILSDTIIIVFLAIIIFTFKVTF
tara:strand:- start:3206 stop:3991 length:786 start_codon:yes stop_codon:yes gene_type:complete